jgi:hypothetical protein
MRKRLGLAWLIGSVGLSVGGCATPAPIVRLAPVSPDVLWVSGRASVAQEQEGIRVGAAFDHQDGPTLGLRVEVENATEANVDVDPHEFTYTTCRGTALATCGATRRIVDPEEVLAALDERQSREQADATNSQAFLGTMVILSAVGDVASIASGHADHHTGDNTVAAANFMESDAAVHETRLASIAVQQQVWSNEALRRTTLTAGRGTGGRIYLPIDLDAQTVWLHVRTGGRVFSFPFRQSVTRPAVAGGSVPHNRQ